jgi:hypothetical protein
VTDFWVEAPRRAVELVDSETPTDDAYVLTDAGAEMFRRDDEERANAQNN